ncbi:TPA: hypothetical protein ACH3X2_002138 [Trebouxia sp. C0005]
MGDAVSHEELVAIVRTNYQKTQEEFCDLRQSIAADAEELDEKITELKSLLLQSTGFKLPGPTDAAGVASTLETADKQDAAEDFPGKFCKVKQSLATASGMPQPSSLPSPPGLPIAVTPTLTNGYPSIGNAASGPNPSMPSLAPTPAVWQWCIDSFSLHNVERHALAQLEDLRQTGSVAEYKAAHNVLAVQTNLPMQLRIYSWERGLKPEIGAGIKVDPLTYKGYTDIEKAQ